MSAELATITPDGEIVERRVPITLFGTDDPSAVVERASSVATALAQVIKERRLSSRISGKEHVNVEGWTLLGSMLGVFAEVEWSRPLDNGWEARAVARTLQGNIVGAADAMCTRSEGSWSKRDEYALRSMAQTRAVSKALRLPLGFLMHLAGYSATPAEEMGDEQEPSRGPARAASTPRGSAPSNTYRRSELAALMKEHSLGLDAVEAVADRLGITERPMSDESMDRLIEAITSERAASAHAPAPSTPHPDEPASGAATPEAVDSPPVDAPPAAPTMEDVLAAAGPGAEELPPRPGTPAYRALPNGVERSRAKAYWESQREPEPVQESLVEALGGPSDG